MPRANRPKGGVTVVRGGTLVDHSGERRGDVLIEGDRIAEVAENLAVPSRARVLEADGCLVGPGFVDLHVHLRQPGREEAETIETGARAAAQGGYTAVVAMPNTEPAIDSAGVAQEVMELARDVAVEVMVAGAITVGRQGERLAPMAELASLGVRMFTDDGAGVQDGALMRRALDYARGLGVTLAEHCEDDALAHYGAMHEGAWSSRLGIPGMPAAAEEAMVARDVALARDTGARLHLLHLSTAGSVSLLRQARADGSTVTAEATPHHLVLTDAEVASYDPLYRVNPPLRTADDTEAVRQGVIDGTIDAIATDHAPHTSEAKEMPFAEAPPGMLGLETAVPVTFSALGDVNNGNGALSYQEIWAAMSWKPASIAGLASQGQPIARGSVANMCILDPTQTWVVDPHAFASRSRNTPFAGQTMTGRVRHTIVDGEPVVIDGSAQR